MTRAEAEDKVRKLIALAKDPSTDPAHQANLIERAHAIGRKHGFDASQVRPASTRVRRTSPRTTTHTRTRPTVSAAERQRRAEMITSLMFGGYLSMIEASVIGSEAMTCSGERFSELLEPARQRLKWHVEMQRAEQARKAARRRFWKITLTYGGIAVLWAAGTITVIVHGIMS